MKKRTIALVVALVLGLIVGGLLHEHREVPWLRSLILDWLNLVGQLFLRLIFMIVVPLIFAALILGVFELGAARGFGRVLRKTLTFTVVLSSIAAIIGLVLVNTVRPGAGVTIGTGGAGGGGVKLEDTAKIQAQAQATKPITQILLDLVPRNPLEAAVKAFDGEIVAFMVFCLIFGIALSLSSVREGAQRTIVPILEQVLAACLKVVEFAMVLAPAAVFALVLNAAFKYGFGIVEQLGAFVGVVFVGLLIQQVVVYPIMLKVFAKRSPRAFYSGCREVFVYAFSTSSSNATLPKSLQTAETRLGIPPRVARFVLTVGATANQNGTALFEGVTVLFLAQVYGIELTTVQQAQIILMAIIGGIGTAGVPGGALPIILILAQSVGVPAEGMGLIIGVDRFLDMCRTVVNVTGDLVIAAIVGRGEGRGEEPAAA